MDRERDTLFYRQRCRELKQQLAAANKEIEEDAQIMHALKEIIFQELAEKRLLEQQLAAARAAKERKRPEIICLCGSTRFTNEMLIKQWELTKEGKIVLSWCALPESYLMGPYIGEAQGVKDIVDEGHKRKIDLCDSVFVIDVDGYIGESTCSEVEYAKAIGKTVVFLSEQEQKGGE